MAKFSSKASVYREFPADLYDLIFPADYDGEEFTFYKYFLTKSYGRALELGCGTGNFILEYRRNGLFVDGLDCSKQMLAACKKKMDVFNLGTQFFARMEELEKLDLKNSYDTIYVPACIFMSIIDRKKAFEALKNFRRILKAGGQLILSIFLAKEEVFCNYKNFLLWKNLSKSDRERVLIYEHLEYKFVDQVRRGIYKFEFYLKDKLERVELFEKNWRWYGVREFEEILKGIGFREIEIYGDFFLEPVSEAHNIAVFRAIF